MTIVRRGQHLRKVYDLQRALRKNRLATLFVVIGDPGSGKSVALRKLARDLLHDVAKTDRIPIYFNLKEWRTAQPWSRQSPPTEDDFIAFPKSNLMKRLPNVSKPFVKDFFDRLSLSGRIFYILDSFDEIPALLDADEASWLVRHLSTLISRSALSGKDARAILAPRYYRRPRIEVAHACTLEIRPFSDQRIGMAIDQIALDPQALKRSIFNERPDLASKARNPFLLSLLLQFCSQHAPALPASSLELFESYLNDSFILAKDFMPM